MTTNPHAARHDAILALRSQGKTAAQIARELGADHSSIARSLRRMARRGIAPGMVQVPVPDGMRMARTCVYYDEAGNVKGEWRRMSPDAEAVQEFVDGLCEQVRGKASKLPSPPKGCEQDLMLELPIFDAHIGKYSWAEECGPDQDWTTDDACRIYLDGVRMVLARSPAAGRCVVVFGGDFFHADNRQNVTEKSGHALDVDTRYGRNIKAGAKLARDVIDAALQKAERVTVVVLRGNHSWVSEAWMAMVLEAYYHGSDRVTVVRNNSPRTYIRHGKCLLGLAHGDAGKAKDYPQYMAVEAAADWAATRYRVYHLGHIHKSHSLHPVCIDTHVGTIVEYLPSLTSTDAWHSEMGYVNPQRVVESFVWHAEHGIQTRITVPYHQIVAGV